MQFYINKSILTMQLIILSHAFSFVVSLPIILPTTAVLLPNVGQYLSLIQILVLKLIIWTQIMRLLGQDYVGKGIKSSTPLSEQENLDEILDYDDMRAQEELNGLDRAESQHETTIQYKPQLYFQNHMNQPFNNLKRYNMNESALHATQRWSSPSFLRRIKRSIELKKYSTISKELLIKYYKNVVL